MAVIREKDARELRKHLEALLTSPVTLDLYTRPSSGLWVPGWESCETCDDARRLLEELAGLSDRITLRVHDVAEAVPASGGTDGGAVPTIVVSGAARGTVRFLGLPAGLEFGTLLRTLVDVAAGSTSLAAETKETLRGLTRDVHIRVFVTPTCPFCPRVAQIAHQMAIESPRVTADVIEAQEFPELSDRYQVRGVPKTVLNDAVEFVGAQPEASFLAHVMRAAA